MDRDQPLHRGGEANQNAGSFGRARMLSSLLLPLLRDLDLTSQGNSQPVAALQKDRPEL